MLHLSQLILNHHNWEVRRDLKSPYDLHRTIENAFPHDPPRPGERVLFRLDYQPRAKEWRVLVQSHYAPNWSFFQNEDRRGYLQTEPQVITFEPRFYKDKHYNFRLLANPTFKTTLADGRKVRFRESTKEKQLAWLLRKFIEAGVNPLDIGIVQQGTRKSQKKEEGQQTHFAVLFEGILQVADPDKLRLTVESGIGSAKGFGFGLLSLAPA
jgi:CRISPR system Cascade subunit CasE